MLAVAVGGSKRPAFSPAHPGAPRRAVAGKAAANYHFIRGGWDDPNGARPLYPVFAFKGSLVDPRMRVSNEAILIL